MNPTRTTELKVGLFTLFGLAVLVGGVMWGRQMSVGGSSQMIAIHFPTSSGLIEGDPVSINGLKKGRVEKIDIDGNGVMVHASLEKVIALKSDATATIMMLELMGGKKIDIRPGIASSPLDAGAVIQGETDMDIPAAVAKLGGLSGDLTRVLFRADTLLGSVNHLMADTVFVNSIRHAVVTLDATVVLVKNFVARNQDDMESTLKDVKIIVGDVKDFIKTNRPHIETLLKDADKTLTNVDSTLSRADSALASVNGMMDDIKKNGGALHKLIYDKDLADRLDSTLVSVNRLMGFILDHGVNINVRLGTRP